MCVVIVVGIVLLVLVVFWVEYLVEGVLGEVVMCCCLWIKYDDVVVGCLVVVIGVFDEVLVDSFGILVVVVKGYMYLVVVGLIIGWDEGIVFFGEIGIDWLVIDVGVLIEGDDIVGGWNDSWL